MANTGTSEMLMTTFNFAVEIDSVTVAFFKEAKGLTSEVEVITHQVVNKQGKQITQKVAGHASTGEFTITKTMDGNKYLAVVVHGGQERQVRHLPPQRLDRDVRSPGQRDGPVELHQRLAEVVERLGPRLQRRQRRHRGDRHHP